MTRMGEERAPRSWLTSEVLMDPLLFSDLRLAFEARAGADGYLLARRLVDERLRAVVHWPRGCDYAQVADDLAAGGRQDEAALLRKVAATDGLLTEAQARWNSRYAGRAETGAEREARRLIEAGLIDFDPDGPYPGIDGSLYWPGYTSLETGPVQVPVVAVAGRGLRELVTGFDDQAAVARWLHDRGPMASGPLGVPDVPSLPRAVLEEHILARMLRRPGSARAMAEQVPPVTFTADARYDIYAAIIYVASRGRPWDSRHVKSELGHRMNGVPDWALPRYGGQGGPWAQAYLRRLAATEPLSYAASQLVADDTQAQFRAGGPAAAAQRPAEAISRPRPIPETGRWQRRTSVADRQADRTWRPPPEPGPHGPVPRI